MYLTTMHDQELSFVARLDVTPRTRNGADGGEAKHEIAIDLARADAPKAWAEMPEVLRGPEPVVKIDLSARAKEAGIEVKDLVSALRRDAVFADLVRRSRLVLG